MRIGILGGTFDPPHLGHELVGDLANEWLNLDKMIVVPAGQNPLKTHQPFASAEHRYAMCRIAFQRPKAHPDDPDRFEVSRIEIDREGPSYTVDTIRAIRQQYPNDDLFFVIGADNLEGIARWHDIDDLVGMCRMALFGRGDVASDALLDAMESLPQNVQDSILLVEDEALAVQSSTNIRGGINDPETWNGMSTTVLDYIQENGLYGISVP